MEFRDLEAFNFTFLAKQGWRLLQEPTSLVVKELKAKYSPNTTFLEAKGRTGISFTWRSILEVKELLKKG